MNDANKTYTFVQDSGHGWVEVPLKDVEQSGVLKDIALYSYKNNKYAYLEDLDAQTFLSAMESKGYTITLNNKHIEDFETVINKRKLKSIPIKILSREDEIRVADPAIQRSRVIEEHATVRLTAVVNDEGATFPVGTTGAVVSVYNGGQAFAVEVVNGLKEPTVITVLAAQLEVVP